MVHHLEHFTVLSPTGKPKLFIAKWSSSTYNKFSSLTGKKPFFLSIFPSFIQKAKLVGLPKVTFGLPNASISYNLLQIIKLYKSLTSPSHEEGLAWSSKNFLHAAASAARLSNELGSRNWMFSSNLSACFRMASILAVFKRTCSSKSCTLMAVWPI